ncbi:hypothetical protein A2U01_0098096, partial [Trifolium medium]|nr:hypothetical protein [Trifolium medium]
MRKLLLEVAPGAGQLALGVGNLEKKGKSTRTAAPGAEALA